MTINEMFDDSWFKDHQNLLLWLLNTPVVSLWFRWVLRINGSRSSVGNRKIVQIYPHAITWVEKRVGRKVQLSTEFRTHAKFTKRLYYAFRPFWHLLHFWDMNFANRFFPDLNLGFDSTGDLFSTSEDGVIKYDASATWAGARDAAAGTGIDKTSATNSQWSIATLFGGNYYVYRGHDIFNTSVIGGGASIDAGVYSRIYTARKDVDSASACLVKFTPGDYTAVVAGDFDLHGTTEYANRKTLASLDVAGSTYTDWTLTGTLADLVDPAGYTGIGTRISRDLDNSAPTGDGNELGGKNSETAATTSDPKLVITYTPAPAAGGNAFMSY